MSQNIRRLIAPWLFLLTACADVASAPLNLPGGYTAVPVNQSELTQAAAFAVEAERQALRPPGSRRRWNC